MPFPNGIPSVSTMSRVLASVDEEMVSLALINWIGEISNTRGTHIAIDGKGLRAAASKVRDEKTPYVLNVIDAAAKLVVGQFVIQKKTNELAAIPEAIGILEIEGSTVTIDAVGTTEKIMDAIHDNGGEFVLQVKKNCPALYEELMGLFEGLSKEKKEDEKGFADKYGAHYSEAETAEKNRERYEYRRYQSYSDPDGIKGIQEEWPYVECVGKARHVRILQVRDGQGKDITPGLADFMREGSRKQPRPTAEGGSENGIECFGLIASKELDAEKMMRYKREHWTVENSLHYVLDEIFGEDKSTVRRGKNTMSILRKLAYDIARLLQMESPKGRENIPDVLDDICDDLEIGFRMIFRSIPSRY